MRRIFTGGGERKAVTEGEAKEKLLGGKRKATGGKREAVQEGAQEKLFTWGAKVKLLGGDRKAHPKGGRKKS